MDNLTLNEPEVASKSRVMEVARRFTETLAETAQYRALEETYQAFRQDGEAQAAYTALQTKQQTLRMVTMLNAVGEEDRLALKQLEDQFYGLKSVQNYIQAQETLISMCQEIGDILSDAVGLNFGLACRVGGCCG
ncbi:MAG: YlbF family regulator [Brevefilum sp.]|nr:YlbF family regulator [Brevefilum sp.]